MGAKTMRKTGAPSGTKKMAYNWQTETLISRLAPLQHEVNNSSNKVVVVVHIEQITASALMQQLQLS